jgi:tetratricopeptide (TPR) repeat protein
MKRLIFISVALILATLFSRAAYAEVKIIEVGTAYTLGDNDSKLDARRIAIQEAKRKSLELAGAYVESLTQVKNYQLTKDEINSYTAGVVETDVASEEMRGTTEHPVIYIKTRCKIDTAVLMTQIDKFRESEELKEQLVASAEENADLKKERDALVRQLNAEKDKEKIANTRQKLDTVLAKEEANDETHKVWINIGPQLVQVDENGQQIKKADLDNSSVILERAIKVNPENQRARLLLASVYEKQGNSGAAEQELRAAIRHNPSNLAQHMKLGVLLHDRGKYQDALQEFHFVERLRPRYPMMLFYTGMTFKQLGICGRSVRYLNRFLHDPRVRNYPAKREKAVLTVEECGGGRPGRARRFRER